MNPSLNTESQLPRFALAHPELFALLASSGWRAMHASPAAAAADWELAGEHFFINDAGMDIQLELGGILIKPAPGGPHAQVRFSPNDQLRYLVRNAGFHIDVHKILGNSHQPPPQDGYPVAEVNGSILFVLDDYRAALIDHSLCGFFRAPNPFIILDWMLLRIESPLLEHHATHQGARIASHLDDHGRLVTPA